MMCPMEHIEITQIGNKSMTNKAKKLINKNFKDKPDKLNHNGETFSLCHGLVNYLIDNVSKFKKDSKVRLFV